MSDDLGDDWFVDAMSLAMVMFVALATVTSIVHLAYQFGFRLTQVPFLPIIEYSLLMAALTVVTLVLYAIDLPYVSLSDLDFEQQSLDDWEEEEIKE